MSDTIGVGVLKTVVDNSGMAAGIAQGVRDLNKFTEAADKAGASVDGALGGIKDQADKAGEATGKLDATTKRFLTNLERMGEQAGRSKSEFLELRAAQLGVSTESEKYIARIRAAEKAQDDMKKSASGAAGALNGLGAAEKTLNNVGMSAKATAAALRNVPAQFTDIVVSLQGGQAPLTVFLQQGGQLKDMFNGAGNAAKALFGYVAGLVTPFTALAAAAAVVALAYYQGSKEAGEYNKALIMSGNFAGATTDQLGSMARGFRDLGITQGKAAETLAAVVGTGRIAASELEMVAQATINLTKVGGQDMKQALDNFIALGDDPVKASQKLNDSFNYLTLATYEQIKALAEQGRQEEAAALAQRSFASAVNDRANKVVESLGYIESAYNSVIKTAKLAWDAMLNVGRDSSFAEKYTAQMDVVYGAKTMAEKAKGTRMGDMAATRYQEENAKLNEMMRQYQADADKAKAEGAAAQQNKRGIDAADAVKKLQDQAKGVASVTEELKKYHVQLEAIRKANPDSELLSPENIKKGEDAIRKAHQGPQARQKAYQDGEGTRLLQTLRDQGAALQSQLDTDENLTNSQKERAKFEQLIADLKNKDILTADQKSLLANETALRAQYEKNEALDREVATKKENEKIQKEIEASEKRAYDTFMARITNNTLSMTSKQEGRSDEYARNLGAYGQGDQARQQLEAQRSIYKEYERYQLELQKSTPSNLLGSDQYKAAVAEIQANLTTALAAQKVYYDDVKALEADASVGQRQAIQNYIDSAANVAKSTAQMWTSGMSAAEDALVNFVQTGKLSFKSLANSIIADMIRIQARQAGSSLLSSIFNIATNALGGGWSAAGLQSSGAVTSAVSGGSGAVGIPLPGMSAGGYTGDGGKYDPAGIVHRGEVVFSQDDVSRHGGVASVEALRKRGGRGFAGGGAVGGSSGGFAGGGNIIIQNNGAPVEVTEKKETPNGSGGMDITLVIRQIEGQMASNVQSGTGPMSRAIENRYGSKTSTR